MNKLLFKIFNPGKYESQKVGNTTLETKVTEIEGDEWQKEFVEKVMKPLISKINEMIDLLNKVP